MAAMICCEIEDIGLCLQTEDTLFSPQRVDRGTMAMISCLDLHKGQKVLDLGCGYGVIGIYCAKIVGEENVFMTDINPRAVDIARENARLNGFRGLSVIVSDAFEHIKEKDFDYILTNPPYHEDFSVPKAFIEDGLRHLRMGGTMLLVTKRYQWYKNKLCAVFGGVKVMEKDGYYIFAAEKRECRKRANTAGNKLSRKLKRKYGK